MKSEEEIKCSTISNSYAQCPRDAVADINAKNRMNVGKHSDELKVKCDQLVALISQVFNCKHYVNYRSKFIAIKVETTTRTTLEATINSAYGAFQQLLIDFDVEVVNNVNTGYTIYRIK